MNALAQSCAAGRAHRSVSRLSAVASPGWSGVPAKSLSPSVYSHTRGDRCASSPSALSREGTRRREQPLTARGSSGTTKCVSVPLRWGAQLAAPRPAQRTTLTGHTELPAANGSVSGPGGVGPPPRAVLGRTVSPGGRRRLVAHGSATIAVSSALLPRIVVFVRRSLLTHAERRVLFLRAVATARVLEEPPIQKRPVQTQSQTLSAVHVPPRWGDAYGWPRRPQPGAASPYPRTSVSTLTHHGSTHRGCDRKDDRIAELERRLTECESRTTETDRAADAALKKADANKDRVRELQGRELEKGHTSERDYRPPRDTDYERSPREAYQGRRTNVLPRSGLERSLDRTDGVALAHGDLLPIQQLARMDADMRRSTANSSPPDWPRNSGRPERTRSATTPGRTAVSPSPSTSPRATSNTGSAGRKTGSARRMPETRLGDDRRDPRALHPPPRGQQTHPAKERARVHRAPTPPPTDAEIPGETTIPADSEAMSDP